MSEHANLRNLPWAVRPEILPAISAALDTSEKPEPEAAIPDVKSERRTGVAVLPLTGVIVPRGSLWTMLFGGTGLNVWRKSFRAAVADDDVDTILLDIDSPGGSVAMMEETAAEIRAAREVKPVVAVANTMAASGGYYLASQATELFVSPSGQVGSVGVYLLHVNQREHYVEKGFEPTLISAGKYKTEGHFLTPLTDEALAALQASVDDYYESFLSSVAAGRGTSVETVRGGYGEGRLVNAREALKLEMVDGIASLDETLARITGKTSQNKPAASQANQSGRLNALKLARPRHSAPKEGK